MESERCGTLKFLVDEPEARAGYDGLTITARGEGMAYKLPNDKQIGVRVSYVDAKGNPASVDGDVTWDTSDPTIATVNVDPDHGESANATVVPAGRRRAQAQGAARPSPCRSRDQ
jgi:hypothetical protein